MLGLTVEFNFEMPPELEPGNFDSMLDDVVEKLAEVARDEWIRQARENLKTTQETYIENISQIERPDATEAVITLTGDLPNMLEMGATAFDMKPGLLQNAKIGKTGARYQDVPFKKGSPSQTKLPSLPKDVFKKANTLQMGERYSDKSRLKNYNMGRPGGYEHKTGIYDDMHRARPKGQGLNEFQSFRRVSDNSDPMSWIHPGFKPLLLSEKVRDYLDTQLDAVIESVIGNK